MFAKILGSLLVTLLPFLPHSDKPIFELAIRPLAWSSLSLYDVMQGIEAPFVKNHCTTWAYQKPHEHQTHWITAAHCVLDDETGELADNDYQVDGHYLYVEDWDQTNDVASMATYDDVYAKGLRLADHEPTIYRPGHLQDSLTIVRGYPYGFDQMFTSIGWLVRAHFHDKRDADGVFYEVYTAPIASGNSGSPVFDRNDKVYGVLQVGWGEDGFSAASGGLDLKDLKTFLDQLPN